MKKAITLFAAICAIHYSSAQTALETKFGHFIGNWKGSGTITEQNREASFDQTEEISWAAGKSAILIKGLAKDQETNDTTFQALGVIYFDTATEEFKILAIRDSGESVVATLETPEPKLMKWGFDVPGGRVNYTTDLRSGKWVENGEFSPEGTEQSYPFFGMELEKTGN